MAALQLNFTLRTSGNVKTVHLAGSWDNYKGQLPLSKDSSKTGGWKGTFRFPASTMQQGQRYWYYYIIDGYHASHDPARESVVEPTTSRRLNILDIPAAGKSSASEQQTSTRSSTTRHSRRVSLAIPKGNPLPASSIVSPKPYKPGQTRQICAEQFAHATMEQLAARLATQQLSQSDSESESASESESDDDSDVPSLASSHSSSSASSRTSSRATSPTSSVASSRCSCERYGITRAGGRVKLDCGGSRCGGSSSEDDEDCVSGSDSEEDEEEEDAARRRAHEKMLAYRRAALAAQQQQQQKVVRRQGMVMRS